MKKILALLCAVIALCGFSGSARATDMFFLVFTGNSAIPGESTVEGHAGEIDVVSFSMGVNNSMSSRYGGVVAGKLQFQDVTVSKPLDKASPKLVLGCAKGEHYPTVVLKAVRSTGNSSVEYCTVTLSDVIITSVQHRGGMVNDGAAGTTGAMSETVSLNFGRIQFAYKVFDANGKFTGTVVSGWDVARNIGL